VLGRAYFASGRFREAAELVDRALEANGDDYNVRQSPFAMRAGAAEPESEYR
jgi:tetratricopeptide (TPR) repeat protein